jgi:hypothetical protein
MRPAIFSLTLVIALSTGALAAPQQDTPAEGSPAQVSPEQIQTLLDRINQLEKRVAELEAKNGTAAHAPADQTVAAQAQTPTAQAEAPAAQTTAPAPQTAPGTAEHVDPAQGMHQQVAAEAETFPSLHIRGFADVDFAANDQPIVPISPTGPNSPNGFYLGQFVLHFASALSKKVSYFAEVSLTAQPNLYNVDLERSFIRYDINDAAKVSFGRYHTPINYWNTAFHHGAWLQTTIDRPNMIRFGGTFEPVHFVGAQSEGTIPSGGLNLGYNVGIGNGRGSIFSRAGDNGDVNNNRAWLLNVFSRPTRFQHLQVGGSFYRDLLSSNTATPLGTRFSEWIAAGHLIWTSEAPEFLAEFANVHHRSELTGQEFDSHGGYVQVAYRLPIWERRWKPYFRYDYLQVPAGDPTFAPIVPNVRGFTLGTRYDISDFAAFKAEYRNNRGAPGLGRLNTAVVQTSFTF